MWKVIFKKTKVESTEYSLEDALHIIIENQQQLIAFAWFFKKFLEEKISVSEYEFTWQKKYENPFYILDVFKDCAEDNRDNIKSIRDYLLSKDN